MTIGSMQSVGYLVLPTALGATLAVLAWCVAFALAQRALSSPSGARRHGWFAAAALAAACGIVAAQLLNLEQVMAGAGAGFRTGWTFVSLLVVMALAGAAAHCGFGADAGIARSLAGAAVFATAALAGQTMLVLALGVQPGLSWNPALLGTGWLAGVVGFASALRLLAPAPDEADTARLPLRIAAGVVAGIAMLLGQTLSVAAASLPAAMPLHDASLLSPATTSTLALAGTGALLALLLLAAFADARRRSGGGARPRTHGDAFRDGLTRLPTRAAFDGLLSQVLQHADAAHTTAVLMHIGLDRFRQVNDELGHQTGDAVLKAVARRLRELAPPHRVARLGGDEFLMLVDGGDAAQRAKALATAVLEAVAAPGLVEGRELAMSCSIGMAHYPQHGAQSVLLSHATTATRASKAGGGATYSVFDPRMVDDVRDQAELLADLRQALSRNQLELYYQPKIHAPSAQVTAAEALLRWHHPRRGMISPTLFIPMAERSGLIHTLGAWVIDEACKQARIWRDQGLRMRVAINLSAQQLRQPELPARIAAALAKHQINPDLLTCEITESVAMEDTETTLRVFTELAAVGVHISIDDFGAGYSSLAYLRKLPATELKMDRGFVLDLENSEGARKIAEAVVHMAQALNMKVVAEGVETDGQYQILRRLGYDQVQGFLFAKPMTAAALALWASGSEGPRSIQFRESLFKETAALEA